MGDAEFEDQENKFLMAKYKVINQSFVGMENSFPFQPTI